MDFTKLTEYFDSLTIPARDIMVTLDGQCVYRRQGGFRDDAATRPMDGTEAYWVYSMTKPLTMCCALRLIEEGRLSLSDAVCEYLPEFSRYPSMTIEHLMSMRGGLDYDLNAPQILAKGPDATTREIAGALADKPLSFAPGEDFQYSLCHDVMAAVIEVISGEKFADFMARVIFKPLGMEHSGFHLTDWQKANMCAMHEMTDDQKSYIPVDRFKNIYALTPKYESGGAGLITTVEDYMRFASAMAQGGAGVIGKETIDLWRARLLTGKPKASFDLLERHGYNYALGVRVLVDKKWSKSALGEFGWDGAAGAYVLMDPKNRLAIVYGQHVHKCGIAYSDIHPTLRDLTYEALGL